MPTHLKFPKVPQQVPAVEKDIVARAQFVSVYGPLPAVTHYP